MSIVIEATEEGIHNCAGLVRSNYVRSEERESTLTVFQDLDNEKWNLRVGLEFIEMNFCPFCGATL